jgi:hypothetical protein
MERILPLEFKISNQTLEEGASAMESGLAVLFLKRRGKENAEFRFQHFLCDLLSSAF